MPSLAGDRRPAVQECRDSGDVGIDRLRRSLLPFSAQAWGGRNSNSSLSAPPDRTEPENLEVSATFWMGDPAALPRCIECLQRVRCSDDGAEVRAYPATPPRSATRAMPTQMLQCRNLRAQTLVLSQSSKGSDVAMTDIEENVPSVGQEMTGSVSSELQPVFEVQPMFPVWEAR